MLWKENTEEFADHFTSKIQKIWNMLHSHSFYTPHTQRNSQQFINFPPITKELVKRVIAKLKTKSCELDSIP